MTGYSGVVLAGGLSSRFASKRKPEDKARFVYRDKPLAQWALESLAGAGERFIVANRDYPEFGVPVYADLLPGGGSLSGLHAALHFAKADWVALAACDMPFLTPAYWALLLQRRPEHSSAAPVVIGKGPSNSFQPLAALYHRSLLEKVAHNIQAERLSLHRLAREEGAVTVPWRELSPLGKDLFLNANRKDDLP